MFLKSLTLKGFKSFAESATLEFEPGVTVVVGPNGSGKSNIVDAVAWVLGAQGARALRGSKMEDVIFAGTVKRTALGRAEVSLTIDNSAGLLPIDFSEVCITRTLWRTGESEYAINGAPCRLLDVQELLSDTGVGRQQHTLISQQQLDWVLSARPEDRRSVIEEAAGVSKHRRRKEKAERRLESTEAALLRAQDLLKEVRRQLRPLQRQAEAAQRYAQVTGELNDLRRYLYGRELVVLAGRLAASGTAKSGLAQAEAEHVAQLAGVDTAVAEAEAALDEARHSSHQADLAELVSTAEGLRARAVGLVALLGERARGVERERDAAVDADVVSSLEAEAASLRADLGSTEAEAEALLPLETDLVAGEEELAREAAEVEEMFAPGPEADEGPVPAAQQAGEMRAELAALRRSAEQAEAELARAASRGESLAGRRQRLDEERSRAEAALGEAETAVPVLAARAQDAAGALAQAEAELNGAQEAVRAAEANRHRWSARAEALSQALDEARARAGARRLASVDGMLGALLELVEVDDGYQAAFEAAAGEALSAVVMSGEAAAREGLAHLFSQGQPGAVIALKPSGPGPVAALGPSEPADLIAALGPSEPADLIAALGPSGPGAGQMAVLPAGAVALSAVARSSHPEVDGFLSQLLARSIVVEGSWAQAVDCAVQHPDLVVVTRQGDRCCAGIWRTGSAGTGATGAALEEARAALEAATVASARAAEAEGAAKRSLSEAQVQEGQSRRAVAENANALRTAQEAVARAGRDLAELEPEGRALHAQQADLSARRQRDEGRAQQLALDLPELEAQATREADRAQSERAARARLAERAQALATLRRDLEVRATGLEERRVVLSRRLDEVERRLAGHAAERERAAAKREKLETTATALARLTRVVEARRELVEVALTQLRELRRAQSESLRESAEALEALRRQRSSLERHLAGLREQASRVELEEAQAQDRLESLTEAVRRDLDCEPGSLEGAECPELPAGTSAANRARELERELRLMGPVNPLALEEYAALEERHKFLESQLHDVTEARRELAKVIRAIEAEIIAVFNSAYDDVADNFSKLFATLFPGGSGSLSLSDPSNILESGVDIEVRPVGKNVRRLSLLSGGERSLVALAYLFAVFRSRPSPFYMMDEVESALDDVNLHRFLDLVHEFRDESQLLIVSHQKRTMEAADSLYGVTMPPGGSSKVVSQKVDRQAPAVATEGGLGVSQPGPPSAGEPQVPAVAPSSH